jgi:broad specificity phosphatase PhoE
MATTSTPFRHLYLVRHGQTALNAEGRLRGLANPELDDTGLTEARAVARVLATKGIVRVYSSPLERTARTAQIIAEGIGAPWAADERFNDRDYGPWTGEVKADVIARWGAVDNAPGVEPLAEVLARTRPALDSVLDETAQGHIVVVTHDAVIRLLIAAIDPRATDLVMPTGCWNDLARVNGNWIVLATDQKPDS